MAHAHACTHTHTRVQPVDSCRLKTKGPCHARTHTQRQPDKSIMARKYTQFNVWPVLSDGADDGKLRTGDVRVETTGKPPTTEALLTLPALQLYALPRAYAVLMTGDGVGCLYRPMDVHELSQFLPDIIPLDALLDGTAWLAIGKRALGDAMHCAFYRGFRRACDENKSTPPSIILTGLLSERTAKACVRAGVELHATSPTPNSVCDIVAYNKTPLMRTINRLHDAARDNVSDIPHLLACLKRGPLVDGTVAYAIVTVATGCTSGEPFALPPPMPRALQGVRATVAREHPPLRERWMSTREGGD